MTATRLIQLNRTDYPSLGHMLIDLAKRLRAYAASRGICGVPITVEIVEAEVETDLRYSNFKYERGLDAVEDMLITIDRRLPVGETLTMTVEEGVTVFLNNV